MIKSNFIRFSQHLFISMLVPSIIVLYCINSAIVGTPRTNILVRCVAAGHHSKFAEVFDTTFSFPPFLWIDLFKLAILGRRPITVPGQI